MKIDFNRLDDLNARITIVVERSDYAPKLDENLKNYSKKVNMKGFRAGKTPKSVLTKMYGKGMLEESVTSILNEKLFKYLDEEKIGIFGSPMMAEDAEPVDFNTKEPKDYTFTFDLGLKPVFDPDYKIDEPFEITTLGIDQAGLDEDIIRYRRIFGEETPIEEGVVEQNDRITVKLTRILENGSLEENSTETVVDPDRIKGKANELLTGLKIGSTLDTDLEKFFGFDRQALVKNTLNLEEDPSPGTPLIYRVEVIGIGRPQSDELTGEQISKYVGQTVEDEAGFREMLESRDRNNNEARNLEMKKLATRYLLMKKNPFEIPEDFLIRWVNSQREKKIEPGSRDANNLLRDAKWSLLLNRISEKAGLEVTEKDVQKQVTRWIVENVDYLKTDIRKLMKELHANEYFMSSMKETALEEVVISHIMTDIPFVEHEGTPHDYEHAFHDMHHELFDHGEHSHA